VYIILLGAPGAGKGTQAVMLAGKLGLPQVASGDLFRQALANETELGKKARAYMEKGQLVPDEITIQMVLERLAGPDKVVYIKVSEPELLKRLGGRWICRRCQAPYHEVDSPPKVKGVCDRCGGELYQRPDDNVTTIKKRLEVYFKETSPLIDYYQKAGKLLEIDGEGPADGVNQRIAAALRRE